LFLLARITVRTFSIRRDQEIATYVTVRGAKAEEILNKGLAVKEFELKQRNFSSTGICSMLSVFAMLQCLKRRSCACLGNFGFGIDEHIDLGLKYDPSIGIYGMDFYIVLSRPGYRTGRKKHKAGRIGVKHIISKEDAMKWFKSKFNGHISTREQDAGNKDD